MSASKKVFKDLKQMYGASFHDVFINHSLEDYANTKASQITTKLDMLRARKTSKDTREIVQVCSQDIDTNYLNEGFLTCTQYSDANKKMEERIGTLAEKVTKNIMEDNFNAQ